MVIQEEKMMKKYTLSILAIVILASACQKEVHEPENREGEIILSAITSYTQDELSTKGPGDEFFDSDTKTAFSGKDENNQTVSTSSQRERIDWQNGDKIYVNMLYGGSSKGTAVYTVGGYQTATGSDKAISETTSLTSSNGLTSQGDGPHTFRYTYPNGGVNSHIGAIDNSGKFTLKMPEGNLGYTVTSEGKKYVVRDNMDYAFMAGQVSTPGAPSNVKMRLYPYFNAYQFIIGEAPVNYWLTEIKLTSNGYLRTKADKTVTGGVITDGQYAGKQASLSGANDNTCSKVITYSLKEYPGYTNNGIPLWHTDGSIDITLLALPLQQGNLSVQFTLMPMEGNNPQPVTKTLNLTGKTLNPYHKLRVHSIGRADWVYVLEVEPTAEFAQADGTQKGSTYKVLSSYRYKERGNQIIEAQNVKWATEINTGGRDPGTEKWMRISSPNYTPAAHNKPGWISFAYTANGNGGNATESRAITAIAAPPVTVDNPDLSFKDAISMNTHPGNAIENKNNLNSKAEAIDLSMYDLLGNRLPGRTTANCYVVSAPGWYKFPLVYGNTLKNGADYMNGVQGYHHRHDGQPISQPWIRAQLGGTLENDYSAELVWQERIPIEEDGVNRDTFPECSGCDHNHGVIDNLFVQMDNVEAYMYFYIPQHSIIPGNNLIALKKGNDIVWSWHIWVTDQPLEPKDGRYLSTLIGWIPVSLQGSASAMQVYPARTEHLKIVQVDDAGQKIAEGQEAMIIVKQPGNMIQKLKTDRIYKYGRGVYFQYGRKDPMFPAMSTGGGNVTSQIYSNNVQGAGTRLAGNDGSMPNESGSGKDKAFTIKNPYKFLTNSEVFADGGAYWSTSIKTVYDPSPIGYRVIDRYYSNPTPAHFNSSYVESSRWNYLELNNQYNNLVNGKRRGWPGAYLGTSGNLYLPCMGERDKGNSILTGAPLGRTNFGSSPEVAFWSAEGTRLKCDLSSGYNAGKVSEWNSSPFKSEGLPVVCIVE